MIRWLKWVGALLLAVGVLTAIAVAAGRRSPELPNPNGYDRLLPLATPIPNNVGDLDEKGTMATAQFVVAHSNLVADVQKALELPAVVPMVYTSAWMTKRMPELMSLRRLEKALLACARYYQTTGDPHRATAARLAAIKVGQHGVRGGVMIDFMVGAATQINGLAQLSNGISTMDATACQFALSEVQGLQATQEPIASYEGRERRWMLFGSEWWRNLDWELATQLPGMLLNPGKQGGMFLDRTPIQRFQDLQLAYPGTELAIRRRVEGLKTPETPLPSP